MYSRSSATPRRYPPSRPTATETTWETTPASSPTRREVRAPVMNCANTSWPVWVVPSQCRAEGGSSISKEVWLGSKRAIIGPNTASAANTSTMSRPARTFPPRGTRVEMVMAQAPCRVRGSRTTYAASAMRFATITAREMIRNSPCMRGKSCAETAWNRV